ncbi:hypothetical protein BaRGS_00011624 [Batillaria attramentaria]|uniref:Poly [ADP-ribose] polymerase n=1 Tax=Batillaria attramentaria TaxID=370345 RepID=A0ABD0LDM1_9CAEN
MSNPDPSAIPSRNKWILVDEEPHRPSANPGTTNIPGPPSEYENTTPYLTDTQPKRILKPPPPVPVRTAQSGSIADEETIPKAVQAKYPPLRDSAEIGSDSTDTDSDPYDDLLCSSEEESSDHGVYETYVRKDPNDSQIYTPLEAGTSHIYVEIISNPYESIAIAGEDGAHGGDAMAPYEIVTIDKDAKKRVRIAGSVPDGGDGSHGDGNAGSRAAKPPTVPPRRSRRPADVARDTSAPASRTIEVNGDPATLTSEMCWLYFENQRSGGGAVEEVRVAGGVAQRVAAGSHKIHGKPVEVKLSVPPRPGQGTQSKVPSVPRHPQPSPAAGHPLMVAPSEQSPVQNPPVTAASKGQKNATEISLKVEPLRLRLMQAANFKETAENRHPGVKVEMDESNQQIVFRGPGHIAKKAQSDARRLLQSIKSGKATQLTDTQKTVLGTTQGAQYVAQILKYRGVVAVWDTGPQGDIVIHAFLEDQRELPPQSRPVLQSTEWMEHIRSLYDKHPGTLTVLPSQDGRLVCVTGTADILNSAATEVFKFIHTNTLHSEAFRFSPSRQRFVTLFWPNKLADIQNSLKQHKVQITIDDDGSKLCVLGQSEGLVIARTRLEGLGEKILCHEERLTDRHQLKFLYSKNCRKHLDSLGRGCRCVISLEPESPGLLCDGDKTGQNVCNIDSSSSTPAEAGTSSPKPPPRARASDSPQTAAAGATSQVPPVPAKASARDRQSNIKLVIEQGEIAGVRAFRAIESQSRSESVAATPESKDTSKEATPVSKEVGRQRTVSETSTSDRENAPPQRRVSFPAPEVTFEFRGLVLKILKGDITKEDVDLLVIRTNSHLTLTMVPELQKTGVAMAFTGGGMVLFVDCFRFSADLKKAYKSCLEKADSVCVKSVAIPPLGTRGLAGSDQKVTKAAKVFIKTLTKFCSDKQRSVKELRVVTGDLTLLRTFADVVRTKLEKKGIKFTCRENLAVAAHEDPSSPPLQQHDSLALKEASLFVFADDPRNIETAVNEFRELVKDRFIEKTMSDDKVMSLNDEQVARIRRAGKQNDVDVNVNRSAGCLTLRGDHSDVIDTIEEINGIFMAAHVEQQEEKAARTIAQIVQWYFLKGDTAAASQRKEYGLRENRVIEEAFQRRDKCVKFADANGVNCVIDFDAMKQYPEDDPTDVVSVIRRVKITDARHSASTRRPRKWTSKSTLEPVDVVELHPTESEYKDVHRNFLATLGNLDVKINSIKRIENTMLYEQYEAKKFHLERQNPGIENEKSLWHGTSADAITNINRYGFNRSYCGKNATRYGQGVYFAVKSVISTNPSFSPADVTGKRYIYQCKVLVGHSVKGTSDMRFLPKREGETLYDSACNDPDDPDTYLIFNDTQAYPEYLVTFTEQKSPASL